MIGKTLAHYKILDKLGSGGMGDVYRARDTKLGREIALKVLPEEFSRDDSRRKRFHREAQAIAALKHPNIVTIYSVEEAGGVDFLTMELVEGDTLARRIPKDGLTLDQFFEYTIPLADALSSAHERGITHRDLKPNNVMFDRDGRLKVLDFGLAKLLDTALDVERAKTLVQSSDTAVGHIMGTPAYMSPEQAEGKAIDYRTDIFSMGILMYEMATGERPFKGETQISTISAILKDHPKHISEIKRDIPRHVGRIVNRCLEKNAEKRFQSAKDLRNDLEGLKKEIDSGELSQSATGSVSTAAPARTSNKKWMPIAIVGALALIALVVWQFGGVGGDKTTSSSRPSTTANTRAKSDKTMIAVLPFHNLGDAGDEYFAAGMTEEITSRLASVRGLGVISRTSAMQYKDTPKSLQVIGEELGVDYVLEGTVRWSRSDGQERVRITPQLITVADDTHLWSDRYDRTLEDIFAVQSEIAQNIIRELGVNLLDTERQQLEERPTENMEAYQAYLRGRDLWQNTQFLEGEFDDIIVILEEVIRLDPEFVEALSTLSQVHSAKVHEGYDRSEQRKAIAKGYADRCVEIDPGSHHGYVALGTYHYWCRREYEKALEALGRANEIFPSDPGTFAMSGYTMRRMGRFRNAIADLERALKLDPRNALVAVVVGVTYQSLRDFDTAQRYFDLANSISPNNTLNHFYRATLYWAQGDLVASGVVLRSMPQDDTLYPETRMWGAYVSHDIDTVVEMAERMPLRAAMTPTFYTPKETFAARLNWALGNRDAARTGFESSRKHLLELIRERPREARLFAALCVAEAGLGNRAASEKAREKCLEVAEPDLFGDPFYYYKFFEASVLLDDQDQALDQLDAILSRPSEFYHTGWMELDPVCIPLRDNPRFKEILEKHKNEIF